jgi:hypothetical protein
MHGKRLGWMAAVVAGLLVTATTQGDEPNKGKKADTPAPSITLKIDAGNLPPGLLEKLIEAANKSAAKPATKVEEKTVKVATITLSEAIAKAEKAAGGTSVKAEKKGETFVVNLLNKSGGKVRVVLDGTGKVVPGEKKEDKDEDKKKGDKKNENKQEGNQDEKKGEDKKKEKKGDRD